MNQLFSRAVALVAAGGLSLILAACTGSEQEDPSTDSEGTAVNTQEASSSARIQTDGWDSLPRADTDYRSVILAQELVEGDGAGSRLIIQKGIPSSRGAEEHRNNLTLDLRSQGVDVTELEAREISGEQAAGLAYVSGASSRVIQTWYVVKNELRYTINLESEEGAAELSQPALDVLDNIVLGT